MLNKSEKSIWEEATHQFCLNSNSNASNHIFQTFNKQSLSATLF